MIQSSRCLREFGQQSCPAGLYKLRCSRLHRLQRPARHRAVVLAFHSRNQKRQPKSDSRLRPSDSKPWASDAHGLSQQQPLLGPMTFLQRLSWSMRRMLPSKALRKSISSRRLDPSSYIFGRMHKPRKKDVIRPQAASPAHLHAVHDARLHQGTEPCKSQLSSRTTGIAHSTAEADMTVDASSAPARPKSSALPFLTGDTGAALDGRHKPVGLVLVSAHTLATICHLSGGCSGLTLPLSTCWNRPCDPASAK